MKYKLGKKETVAVIGVGFLASEVARRISNSQKTPKTHQAAMLLSGALLYYAGVVIGAGRPPAGYLPDKK